MVGRKEVEGQVATHEYRLVRPALCQGGSAEARSGRRQHPVGTGDARAVCCGVLAVTVFAVFFRSSVGALGHGQPLPCRGPGRDPARATADALRRRSVD
ncbi:hypothetical protein DVDV_2096 [Desulfovibrio sp. DV]|nr:hypothetical protein DVDV_2096 [Desulfovibrio sp. DV]